MPAGLQVWGADGSLRLDTTTSLCRYIGLVGIGPGSSGSVFIPPPARAWYTMVLQADVAPLDTGFSITITGDPYTGQTITWTWNGQFVDPLVTPSYILIYGGY
jgi:hypothetical protein